MIRDAGDPGPARQRRRRVIVVAGVILLIALAAGTALYRSRDDHPTAGLTLDWGGSEGHPACVYQPEDQTAEATITITGWAPRPDKVTLTVTAYADENTSQPVGSSSRSAQVEGTVQMRLLLTIAVERQPHIDEDGVAACRLSVEQ